MLGVRTRESRGRIGMSVIITVIIAYYSSEYSRVDVIWIVK